MRLSEILLEAREADLYHSMSLQKAANVLHNDIMPAAWAHYVPGLGKIRGNSFTRNQNLRFGYRNVILTIDQSKLSNSNKIIPLDAQNVYHQEFNDAQRSVGPPSSLRGYPGSNDRGMSANAQHQEEFVVGDIKNLHRYIKSIQLYGYHEDMPELEDLEVSWQVFRQYVRKYNIPFKVDKTVRNFLDYSKEQGAKQKQKRNPSPIPKVPDAASHVEQKFKASGSEDDYIKSLKTKKFDF